MNWDTFIYYAIASAACWIAGAFTAMRGGRKTAIALSLAGTLIFSVFIAGMWCAIERPPLRTMGETRLWYSLFLSIIGISLYTKFK